MEIFVGNLPGEIQSSDLENLLKNTLKKNIFQKLFKALVNSGSFAKGKVHCRVIQKELQGKVQQYGHINIHSGKLAKCAVDSLNRYKYKGQYLVAREYYHRAYNNDRRNVRWRDTPWRKDERRLEERRGAAEYFWGL